MTLTARTIQDSGSASAAQAAPAAALDRDYAAYVEVGYRRNMLVNVADVALYQGAVSLISLAVVYPALMLRLGASESVVALLPALMVLGMRLPGVATSFKAEQRLRQKPFIVACGIGQRLPWLLLAGAILFWAVDDPNTVIALALLALLGSNVAMGLAQPAWNELIAKTIPPYRWGIFRGASHMLGNAMGLLGGVVVAVIMRGELVSYPGNYSLLFGLCFLVTCVSFAFFLMNREPVVDHGVRHADWPTYARSMLDVLRTDRRFRGFLVYQSLAYCYVIGQGLFMVHAMRTFGLSDAVTGDFVMVSTGAVLVGSLGLGHLGDRHGHRLVLLLAALSYAAAAALAAAAWDWRVMYPAFALLTIAITGQMISMQNLVYQFAPRGRRPTYVAVAAAVPAPFVLLYVLAVGRAMGAFGLRPVLAASGVLAIAALGVLLAVGRPRNPDEQRSEMT